MTVGVVPISLVAGAVCNRAQCAADQGAAPGSSAPAHNATEYGTAHSAPGCTAQTSGAWRRVPIGLFLGEKVTVFGVAIPGAIAITVVARLRIGGSRAQGKGYRHSTPGARA